jgi:hypothetical protein
VVCPDFVHVYESDLKQLLVSVNPSATDDTLYAWSLWRGNTGNTGDMALVAAGAANTFSEYDRNVVPGDVYHYALRWQWTKPTAETWSQFVQYGQVKVGDSCWGTVWGNWEISGGEHRVDWLTVAEGGALRIADDAQILPALNRETASLKCHHKGPGELRIEHSTLFRIGVNVGGGCTGGIRDSRLDRTDLSIATDDFPLIGNAFTCEPDTACSRPRVLVGNSQGGNLLIQGNHGTFVIEVRAEGPATLRDNRFEGHVLLEGGEARLENNVITSSVIARSVYAGQAVATLISNTIVCSGGEGGLQAGRAGSILVSRSRIEDQPSATCGRFISVADTGAVTVTNSSITSRYPHGGYLADIQGDGQLYLSNNDIFSGTLDFQQQSSGRIVGNTLYRSTLRI